MELLERVAGEGGQLLRVEMQLAGPAGDEISALILTFDVGRVLLWADSASGSLCEEQIQPGDSKPADWVIADDADPWWRVLGNPLSRVLDIDPGSGSLGVAMQFRPDGDNPRRIAVLARGGGLAVQLQQPES